VLEQRDEATLEALPEALLESPELTRRSIARQDELPPGFVEAVEGVEEGLHRPCSAGEELDVVHE
jgi:hypothetical protein